MPGLFMAFRVHLRFPECRTIKDRRSRVEGFIRCAKERHGFSAADLSEPLKIDFAEVGLCAVGRGEPEIRGRLERVLEHVENAGETELLGVDEHIFSEVD